MPNVSLGPFNTIAITAVSGVYRIKAPGSFGGTVDLMNIGPGAIFLRVDADPTTSDPNSLQLPANWSLNKVPLDSKGVNVIAGADTTISVRVTT